MLLRDPLKPARPDEAHATTSPLGFAMEIIVLLKVALIWATPATSTRFFVFFTSFFCVTVVVMRGTPYPTTAFFLFAIVLRGPFLVRAFVRVRCPRTGKPRR